MRDATPADLVQSEPLVRLSDLDEYRQGLQRRLSGEWDDEKWTAYRVRFGVYGQKQPGVQMVRIKVPGGVIPTPWLRTLAKVNREFAVGDAHVTTRQDIQIYYVPLERSADLLEALYSQGLTTREACGNTIRNLTACALAGACPRELVDAGKVAANLATAWLRQPLVQHMPRKVKMTVSGCGTDCGASSIHDLSFIAVDKGGAKGFRVTAGGGLGAQPRTAIQVLDFVTEDQLGSVVEALARLHQRYSDRVNRNASRVKFLIKRFGEDKFRALFVEEFERVKALPQRKLPKLDWRDASEAAIERAPVGLVKAHDGTTAVVVSVPLGILSSDQLDALADIAEAAGVKELRATRDQNIAFLGVAADKVDAVVKGVRAIGYDVPESAASQPTLISCPGTTTCRIGITNSQTFARHAFEAAKADPHANGVSVHVSGCQNSCGLHHVADFGLHGMAKKVDGRPAPYYQLHIGGDALTGQVGLLGPAVASKQADQALVLFRRAYGEGKQGGESVRAWAERLGKDGLAAVLKPLEGQDVDGLFVDWGDATDFPGAPMTKGECAAPFASDDLLEDLVNDGLIALDRALFAKDDAFIQASAEAAIRNSARRLLGLRAIPNGDEDSQDALVASVKGAYGDKPELLAVLDKAVSAKGDREAVITFVDNVRALFDAPAPAAEAAVGDLAAILGAAQ